MAKMSSEMSITGRKMSTQNLETFRKRRGVVRVESQIKPLPQERKLTSSLATRLFGRMNQSMDGDEVMSLLSPADTHQVIHIRGPEHPAPLPNFHPRSKSW